MRMNHLIAIPNQGEVVASKNMVHKGMTGVGNGEPPRGNILVLVWQLTFNFTFQPDDMGASASVAAWKW